MGKLWFLIQQRIISRRDLQMLDMVMVMDSAMVMVDMVLVDIIMGRDQQIIFRSIKDQLIQDMDMALDMVMDMDLEAMGMDIVMDMGMVMEDMVDISMENAHWKNSLRMLLTKDQLMQRLDMALGMDMVLGMVGMVTAIDMDMVMDMEVISMENDHWKNSLRMTSTKDQLMQMLDMALDMDMGLVLMGMVMGMVMGMAGMVMAMDMDMAMDMVVITMEKGLLSLWTMP